MTETQPGASSTQDNSGAVQLRTATPSDGDFLFALFASTRSDELAGLAWDPAQAQAFIKMQFNMQVQNYSANYPSAENKIVLLNEQPIGRMLIERTAAEIQLVDIALMPEQRNNGIGGALINDLLKEAAGQGKPVRLQVLNFSPALRLYERLGFACLSDDGVYLEMKWTS